MGCRPPESKGSVDGEWFLAQSRFLLEVVDAFAHTSQDCSFLSLEKREDVNLPVMTTRMYAIDLERSRFASVVTVADHYAHS